MSRWPSSIATTIALTVLVAMVLGSSVQQVVTVGWSYFGLAKQQSADGPNPWLFRRLPGRVAALVDVIEATPNDSRPAILAAFQRGLVQVRLLEGPTPNLTNQIEPGVDLLRRRIEAALSAPRPLIVTHPPKAHTTQGATKPSQHFSDRILIETALADGRWLLFTTNVSLPSPVDPATVKFSRARFVAWLGLALMLGALLSILTARRIVTPLSALAAAVEQSGVSRRHPGHPNARTTGNPGNSGGVQPMQDRLRRFNEDRTRMMGAISHDLRTPLTRLRIRLEDVEDPREKHKCLSDVTSMGEMIDTVITFTRQDTVHEPRLLINVSALIEAVCDDAVDAGAAGNILRDRRRSRSPAALLALRRALATWSKMRCGMGVALTCRSLRSPGWFWSPSTIKDLASLPVSVKRYSNHSIGGILPGTPTREGSD